MPPPKAVRQRVLALREELLARGLDAGADTLCWHLAKEQITCSRATIWRILKAAGKITTQPQKRPRSSWRRFAAERPNELWQSDFIALVHNDHATVIDATTGEILTEHTLDPTRTYQPKNG